MNTKVRNAKRLFWGSFLSLVMAAQVAQAQGTKDVEVATESKLAGVKVPADVFRIKAGSEPQEFKDILKAVVASGGPQVKQGEVEVLVWAGDKYKISRAPQLQKAFSQILTAAGWTYEEDQKVSENGQDLIPVSVIRTQPPRKGIIGFWAPSDDGLILFWTEMLPNAITPAPEPPANPPAATVPPVTTAPVETAPATAPTDAKVIEVANGARQVNVMKGVTPKMPDFPKVEPKPGFVRGYVKDWTGKPLANAKLGVRSTAVGGAYTGSAGKTDANGYYEFAVLFGVASFYAGAYTVDWGDGRAALGLHPADGELDGFASNVGGVENFVLLTYGIADRDKVSDNPQYSGNYYGGTFSVGYSASDDATANYELPAGGQLEIKLTPEGNLFDGSKGQSFILRRKIAASDSYFYVNNVPLGTYRIAATLNGRPIKIKESGPYRNESFGLEPKEANGSAILTFRPGGADAATTLPGHGNWNSLDIRFER